jgi:hypothetical protein
MIIGGLVAFVVFVWGAMMLWRLLASQHTKAENHLRNSILNTALLEQNPHLKLGACERLLVIPGGGPGPKEAHGIPQWTKQRAVEAAKVFLELSVEQRSKTLVLALGAGSMNGPNTRMEDGRVVFECSHVIAFVQEQGVPQENIIGDWISWDTVSNAMVVRLIVDALLDTFEPPRLEIQVFISDFHADRVKACFDWTLHLKPYTKRNVEVIVHRLVSESSTWSTKEEFNKRMAHEQKAVELIHHKREKITTLKQFLAFMLLGGHQGLYKYTHSMYSPSSGAGW